jgi:hypothetical protein
MDGNGDFGFSWVLGKRLEALTAQGLAPEAIESLRGRGESVAAALQTYRAKRQAAGDSGKSSAVGLRDIEQTLASEAAGVIRRAMDDTKVGGQGGLTLLRQGIAQQRAKLQPKVNGDPTQAIVAFLRQQEIRAFLVGMGVQGDPVKAGLAYREAMARGDVDTLMALETWPMGSPVADPELIAQGQAQRAQAVDPIAAAKVQELERLAEAYERTLADALQELPLPAPDPVAEMAAGESDTSEGTS